MLENILRSESYALAMSPGFFQFYALTGVLHAFEDYDCLHPTHISGSSAGALVGGFLASGMKPSRMIDLVLKIKRQDIWDLGGIGGLLKGQLFQRALENDLDIRNIEECLIPFGTTAWEVFGFQTKIITTGDLATAIRASCTFPLLFQPALVDGSLCIDGGVFDTSGMMALPGIPASNLVVNIVCGMQRMKSSKLPEKYSNARVRNLYNHLA
jgi:NTE family protein